MPIPNLPYLTLPYQNHPLLLSFKRLVSLSIPLSERQRRVDRLIDLHVQICMQFLPPVVLGRMGIYML